jgi:hypothetical protein
LVYFTRVWPVTEQITTCQICCCIAIFYSIDIGQRNEVEIENFLEGLELQTFHEVVNHAFNAIRRTDVRPTESTYNNDTFVPRIVSQYRVIQRSEIDWFTIFKWEQRLASLNRIIDGSSWFYFFDDVSIKGRSWYCLSVLYLLYFGHSSHFS